MADLEAKIGIDSLAELLAKRAELVEEVATLRAKYAAWGLADHVRKIELSRIKGRIRAQAAHDKRKVNNEQVDEEAHADGDYIDLIATMTIERTRWVRLENQIDSIDVTIMRGTALVRFAGNEARL